MTMMNSNQTNTTVIGDMPDITRDEAKTILDIKGGHKIIDAYQIPYAIRTIAENMESVESKFPVRKCLAMESGDHCPARIKQCLQHCIRLIFPETLISDDNPSNLKAFFRLKNRWCTNKPSVVVDAVLTLTERLANGKSKYPRDDSECLAWYMDITGGRYHPVLAFHSYDKSSIKMAFLLNYIPNDESFYNIGTTEMVDILQSLKNSGDLETAKEEPEKAMVAELSDDSAKGRQYRVEKEFRSFKRKDYVLTKYCTCFICHRQGHIARYCRHRNEYSGNSWNLYHSTFRECDPGDPLNHNSHTKSTYKIPRNYKDVCESPERSKWEEAIQTEMETMKEYHVYTSLTKKSIPPTTSIIPGRLVYDVKNEDNGEKIFKCRLAAKGYKLKARTNYTDAYPEVIEHSSLRMILSLAAIHGLRIKLVDIKNAFLNGKLESTIYFEPPNEVKQYNDEVWELHKGLYGLKQAPFIWYKTLRRALEARGFTMCPHEPCIAYRSDCIIALYVDYLLMCGQTDKVNTEVVKQLETQFKMEDLGCPRMFLGMNIDMNESGIQLSLRDFTQKIADDFKIQVKDKKVNQPINSKEDIMILQEMVGINNGTIGIKDELNKEEQKRYRSIVGKLQFMASLVRYDLAYATSFLGRFNAKANHKLLKTAEKVLMYAIQNKEFNLKYRRNQTINTEIIPVTPDDEVEESGKTNDYPSPNEWNLTTITNSTFDSDTTRAPQYGYMVFLNGNIIQWKSKHRARPQTSSATVEYVVYERAYIDTLGIKRVLECLNSAPKYMIIANDNMAGLKMCTTLGHREGNRDLDRKYLEVADAVVLDREIKLMYIEDEFNPAHMLTRSLNKNILEKELQVINQ